MKETEKEAGEPKASLKFFFLLMKEMPYSNWPGGFYNQPLIQNTKKTKRKYY